MYENQKVIKMMKNLAMLISLCSAFVANAEQNNIKAANALPAAVTELNKEITSDKITITKPWIRKPASTSVNTAAYFTIHNGMDTDVKLVEANAENGLCKRTEIHGYKPDDKGVMKMYKLESITIPAGQTVEFKPGSNHVMLMSLEKHPEVGDSYTINFKISPATGNSIKIPDIIVKFSVE